MQIACQLVCWTILLNKRSLQFASFWTKYTTLTVIVLLLTRVDFLEDM